MARIMPTRGFFGIGIYQTKNGINVGTLWRSALNFGADFLFTIGARYRHQAADTVKAWRHIPFYTYRTFDDFNEARPKDARLIAIEQTQESVGIYTYVHPERAVYLLGAEDNGLPPSVLGRCQAVVHIPTPMPINVAVAGSIVMFDRAAKVEGKSQVRAIGA